jgi:cytochrome bd ubiquinol oxidase subunit II
LSAVDLTLALLIAGLAAYAVLAGADFGAGFWDLTAGGARRGARVRGMVKRAMGPVWEANHVWLIFVLVIFWTGFPNAFGPVMTTLQVPLFLAALGIVFRGAAFALRGEAATIGEARALGATFALSSVLVPFFFGAALGGFAAGNVPAGGNGDAWSSWTGPTSIFAGATAVATGAYLGAIFLAADSQAAGFDDLVAAFRARALGAAAVAGALAIGGLAVVHGDAPSLYDGLTSGGGLAMIAVSAVTGLATLALVWRGRFALARYSAAVAVGAIVIGLAIAVRPDFLPGQLTLRQAAASDATLHALLPSMAVGLLVLGPSLWLLFRLKLTGRLDPELKPIGDADRDAEERS